LLDARQRYQRNEISREQLRQVEDQEIRAVVRQQESLGLRSITDGEFRRTYKGWRIAVCSAIVGGDSIDATTPWRF
jgi:5-methyltetrahydropteroyltriglutamate--homocysteine methyltransferase